MKHKTAAYISGEAHHNRTALHKSASDAELDNPYTPGCPDWYSWFSGYNDAYIEFWSSEHDNLH